MRISDWSSDVCSSDLRIVWHCVPRLDGDPVFCRLLRPTQLEQGVFEIGLRDMVSSTQDYITNTAVLVTTLTDSRGGAVRITDVAPRLKQYDRIRSEEHTSELQSLMRISYAVFWLKKQQ